MPKKLSEILDAGFRLDPGEYGKSKVLDIKPRTYENNGFVSEYLDVVLEITEGQDAGTEHQYSYNLTWYEKEGKEIAPGYSNLKRDAETVGVIDKLPDDLPMMDLEERVIAVKKAFRGVYFKFKVVTGKPVKNKRTGDMVVYNKTYLQALEKPVAKESTKSYA